MSNSSYGILLLVAWMCWLTVHILLQRDWTTKSLSTNHQRKPKGSRSHNSESLNWWSHCAVVSGMRNTSASVQKCEVINPRKQLLCLTKCCDVSHMSLQTVFVKITFLLTGSQYSAIHKVSPRDIGDRELTLNSLYLLFEYPFFLFMFIAFFSLTLRCCYRKTITLE